MEDTKKIREHIRFSGHVQGVGFRFRASHAANGIGITGWVKNEWDGTVEMEAQGTKEQINKMLTLINAGSYIRIDDLDRKEIPLKKGEYGFHIR
jgi:acylphosphatase